MSRFDRVLHTYQEAKEDIRANDLREEEEEEDTAEDLVVVAEKGKEALLAPPEHVSPICVIISGNSASTLYFSTLISSSHLSSFIPASLLRSPLLTLLPEISSSCPLFSPLPPLPHPLPLRNIFKSPPGPPSPPSQSATFNPHLESPGVFVFQGIR